MDPSVSVSVSVCRLHPGVAVTGFCPACLRDRLAGLQPPAAADLRRCKSFSYARSAAAVEPQRRSCDLFRHGQPPIAAAVPEEEEEEEEEDRHHHHQERGRGRSQSQQQPKRSSSSSLGGLLGKKLQQWRRKNKKEYSEPIPFMPPPEMEMEVPAAWHRRPSCDADPGRASWDAHARSGPGPVPASILSLPMAVEEDDDVNDTMTAAPAVARSDGQIPVEEDYYNDSVPGGSVQTRDYYLDSSSSSSRRRRSVDRSTTSGRNSFSDAANSSERRMMMMMMMNNGNGNGNARAGITAAAERERPLYHYHEAHHHHHQSVLVHHQYCREDEQLQMQQGPNNLRATAGDFFGSSFRDGATVPASKPSKKGIKGWSIWGLISKKSSSSKKYSAAGGAAAAGAEYESYPWPELRARGYDGQMLRCNSSISARSSFSGTTGTGNLSGRRSISGVDMRDAHAAAKYNNNNNNNNGAGFRTRRADEVLLERNPSSSYSRSGGYHDLDPAHMGAGMGMQYHHHLQQQQQQFSSRPPNIPRRSSSSSNSKHGFSTLPAKAKTGRSTLGL